MTEITNSPLSSSSDPSSNANASRHASASVEESFLLNFTKSIRNDSSTTFKQGPSDTYIREDQSSSNASSTKAEESSENHQGPDQIELLSALFTTIFRENSLQFPPPPPIITESQFVIQQTLVNVQYDASKLMYSFTISNENLQVKIKKNDKTLSIVILSDAQLQDELSHRKHELISQLKSNLEFDDIELELDQFQQPQNQQNSNQGEKEKEEKKKIKDLDLDADDTGTL